MIDLEKNLDRYMKKVKDYILDRINTYYSSSCYKKLKNRIERLDASIDMRFHNQRARNALVNEWKSKIAIPLVREAFLARRAVTLSAFRNDPLVAVEPHGSTPTENAVNLQDVLHQNWRATKFRQGSFRRIVNYCSRYGSGVVVSNFRRREEIIPTTAPTEFGMGRVWMARPSNNVVDTDIHPLNHFQDPLTPFANQARYRGYSERMRLSDLVAEVKANPDVFIKQEVEAAIKQAKKSFESNKNYYDVAQSNVEHDAIGVDRVHYYGEIAIDGNEDSPVPYYAQMIGEFMIRFQMNPHDEFIVPISQYHFDQRLNYWWGNVDTENVIPHENIMQLWMSISADEMIRSLERYIFYDAAAIDIADVNNRHKNGGFIPFDGKGRNARDLFNQYQNTNTNALNGLQYLMQEMKESAQRVRPKSDLSRQGLPGGPRNDTATAAMMLDEQGDILEADLLESFSFGILDNAGIDAILLKQHLPSKFQLRPDPRKQARDVMKQEIMGEVMYKYATSLTDNKQIKAQNLLNTLTFLQNMRGTGDPSWLNVNMPALVKGWLRKIDLGISEEELYPPQQQAPQMPQQPMLPGMAPAGQIAAPMPPAQPQPELQPQQEVAVG